MACDALLEDGGVRADADQLVHRRPDHRAGRRRRTRSGRVTRSRGLTRIGIDELSFRKGQRYITVVVDHDTGRLVWAREGRDKKTVLAFFDELGAERTARIRLVSSDLGDWITRAVMERCPQATLCLDPYHVVALATQALDEVRREVWQQARRAGDNPAPAGSRAPAGRYGNGPNGSPNANRPSSPRSSTSTAASTAATSSRRSFDSSSTASRRGRPPARRVARLGAPLPDRELRQARQDDHPEQARHRRDAHPPAL